MKLLLSALSAVTLSLASCAQPSAPGARAPAAVEPPPDGYVGPAQEVTVGPAEESERADTEGSVGGFGGIGNTGNYETRTPSGIAEVDTSCERARSCYRALTLQLCEPGASEDCAEAFRLDKSLDDPQRCDELFYGAGARALPFTQVDRDYRLPDECRS